MYKLSIKILPYYFTSINVDVYYWVLLVVKLLLGQCIMYQQQESNQITTN